ncbi:hypothetical protein V6N13_146780 [Hibiscus sabdariffa]|uniref:Two-component response regulator n=1 Tax=Hibiscus sabdariffa TaxID=183260 RepID=A0ABR2TTW4_9ROSI
MSIVDDNGVAEFPAGLKILIVDGDKTCLLVLERMLRKLSYRVTKSQHARDALALLRGDKNRFDIVMCDLHLPEIDGLKLIEIIVSEMDLPVVMTSSDERQRFVMKGVIKGACDYLVKPVRMESVSLIWQHVVRKRRRLFEAFQQPRIDNINVTDRLSLLQMSNDAAAAASGTVPAIDKRSLQCLRRKSEDISNDGESSDEVTNGKKPRVVWTQELHELFVTAVNQLGHGNDVPKKILERMKAMDVTYLTRANIASHLQKYRMHLQKESARSAANRDLNACQQFQPTHTPPYQLPQQNLANGHVLSTVPNHVDTGSNMFDSNIVSEPPSHCLQTDASLYDLPRPNLLYQNDFPPSDGAAISNEENLHSNAGSVTELSNPFLAADEMFYEPSFLQEEAALVGLQSSMGGYLSFGSNCFGLTQS